MATATKGRRDAGTQGRRAEKARRHAVYERVLRDTCEGDTTVRRVTREGVKLATEYVCKIRGRLRFIVIWWNESGEESMNAAAGDRILAIETVDAERN